MSILKNISIDDLKDPKQLRLNWNFDQLAGVVFGKAATASGAATASVVQVMDILMVGPTTVKSPTGSDAAILVVILRQDGTGGRTITWSGFTGASTAIDRTASTISVFVFAYSPIRNQWVMATEPITGMTP